MKILIIEDELDIRTYLKRNLETECFAVDLAENGEVGLAMARGNIYNLIILDNLLPKKMGIDVCKEYRAGGRTTPILMLSVKTEVNTKVDLLNAGADDYLIKPFSFDELLARVHALIRRPEVIVEQTLSLGDISLDVLKHRVVRGGKNILLTRKELMLLEYFMKNAGMVLSRAMIMEHVWDMNADPFSNTIESHVLSLRKKLDIPNTQKCILTIPGRGYRFDFV